MSVPLLELFPIKDEVIVALLILVDALFVRKRLCVFLGRHFDSTQTAKPHETVICVWWWNAILEAKIHIHKPTLAYFSSGDKGMFVKISWPLNYLSFKIALLSKSFLTINLFCLLLSYLFLLLVNFYNLANKADSDNVTNCLSTYFI